MLADNARRLPRAVLSRVPLGVWERFAPKEVVCPNYHVVSDVQVAHVRHYRHKSNAEFEADVHFAAERYGFIDPDELLHQRLAERPGPRHNRALFTFDDGFSQCATDARPILLSAQASCVFFVVAEFVDNRNVFHETATSLCVERLEALEAAGSLAPLVRELGMGGDAGTSPLDALRQYALGLGFDDTAQIDLLCDRLGVDAQAYVKAHEPYLTKSQIRQLTSDGLVVGAHGLSHRRLVGLSPRELEHQVVAACEFVCDVTGRTPVPFAFPWSGRDLDRALLMDIRRRNPVVGLYFDTGGLQEDVPCVVHRVNGEGGGSLRELLHEAWSTRSAWARAPRARSTRATH